MEGAEGFFRGLTHPVLEPLQGLVAGAFGLVAGRQRRSGAVEAWGVALVAGLLAALAKAFLAADMAVATALLAASALFSGLALASFRAPPRFLVLGLAVFSGLVLGANTVSEGEAGRLATSLGSLAGAALMVIYLTGLGAWLAAREARFDWLHLVPRIAGAWIAAIAILVLAFELGGVAN